MKLNWQLSRFKAIALNLALLLVIYSISRGLFLIFNPSTFAKFTSSEVAKAFWTGLRFDLSAVAFLNIIYILLALLPFAFVLRKGYQTLLKTVFLVLNFPILVFHICDIEYYKFTGARMTMALSAQGGEIVNQFDQFLLNYWYIALCCFFALFAIYFLFQKFGNVSLNAQRDYDQSTASTTAAFRYIAISLAVIIAVGVAARGGLLKKVLTPSYAFTVTRDELAILALNSSFTIIKTHSKDHLPSIAFYPDLATAKNILLKPELNFKGYPQQNIVILMLESFATEFWGVANNGQGYTPFLDSLAKKGLFFRNNFANGRRSIEAVPSVLLSLPSLMDHPLAKSKFQFNDWNGLGTILKKNGYNSAFYHGAETGSMHFDAVAKLSGFDKYFGLEDYPNPEDTDGHWGIYDEPYLLYANKQISQQAQPFVSVIFTLSSHQPYPIPPQYKGKFKTGPTPLHESIGYVDHALEEFFTEAEKQPWFKNTLFILTGDHTQMSPSVNYATELGRYMVPLLLYHPSIKLEADTTKITQHADITPTVVDFLGLKNISLPLFGHSIFQTSSGRAIFYANGKYTLVSQGQALNYDSNNQVLSLFKFDHDPNLAIQAEMTEAQAPFERELKAYIQYFNNGLNSNQLY